MQTIIEKYIDKCGSGLVISTFYNNKINTYAAGYASIKPNKVIMNDTCLFDIASLTKTLCAICVHKYIENKLLNMNDKVSEIDSNFIHLKDVSIQDLLCHRVEIWTDGYLGSAESKEDWYKILYTACIKSKNRTYVDVHYMILSHLLEIVSGNDFYDVLKDVIFKPLNINSATYKPQGLIASNNYWNNEGKINDGIDIGTIHDTKARKALNLGIYTGHAGIFINSIDLLKILESLLTGSILRHSTIKMMLEHDDCDTLNYEILKEIAIKNNMNITQDVNALYESISHFKLLRLENYNYCGTRYHNKITKIDELPTNSSENSIFFSGFTIPSFMIDFDKKVIILIMGNIHLTKLNRQERRSATTKLISKIYQKIAEK